jgi:hypothetical protein
MDVDEKYHFTSRLYQLYVDMADNITTTYTIIHVYYSVEGISHQLDHYVLHGIDCCHRRASLSPPPLLVVVCVVHLMCQATI